MPLRKSDSKKKKKKIEGGLRNPRLTSDMHTCMHIYTHIYMHTHAHALVAKTQDLSVGQRQ